MFLAEQPILSPIGGLRLVIMINLKLQDVNTPFEDYPKAVERWMEKKPFCFRCGGSFKKNGRYLRSLFSIRKIFFLHIQRVLCKQCKISHALLPCKIIPYSTTGTMEREQVLRGYGEKAVIEEIAEEIDVEPRTVSGWCQKFSKRADEITDWAINHLAAHSNEINWLQGALLEGREKISWVFKLLDLFQEYFFPDFSHGTLALLNFLAYELLI